MALDPSIALQAQVPNPANLISSFLDLGQKKLNLDKARDTYDADVAGAQAVSSSQQSKATVDAANVPNLIAQQTAITQGAQANANSAQLQNQQQHAANVMQHATSLLSLPDAQLTTERVKNTIQQNAANEGAPSAVAKQALSEVPDTGNVQDLRNYLVDSLSRAQSVSQQIATQYPAPQAVSTQRGTQFVSSGNSALTHQPAGVPGGAPPLSPPNQFVSTPSGGTALANPASGTAQSIQPNGPQGPQMDFPPNETAQTRDALQGERQVALNNAANAGNLHQINRDIYNLAGSATTGQLGALRNKIGSALGFSVDTNEAADYNSLGKMLARSNQQLAQGMGPHTNAGLEQQNQAGGTTAYDKNTLQKIANLNDALVTGNQMYQQGLESAIAKNGIFGKRQFDQAWGSNFDPDAMRLKNAVDNGDKGQIQMILKQVGGPGSPGAQQLRAKLSALQGLATQ